MWIILAKLLQWCGFHTNLWFQDDDRSHAPLLTFSNVLAFSKNKTGFQSCKLPWLYQQTSSVSHEELWRWNCNALTRNDRRERTRSFVHLLMTTDTQSPKNSVNASFSSCQAMMSDHKEASFRWFQSLTYLRFCIPASQVATAEPLRPVPFWCSNCQKHRHLTGVCRHEHSRDAVSAKSRVCILWVNPPGLPDRSPLTDERRLGSLTKRMIPHCSDFFLFWGKQVQRMLLWDFHFLVSEHSFVRIHFQTMQTDRFIFLSRICHENSQSKVESHFADIKPEHIMRMFSYASAEILYAVLEMELSANCQSDWRLKHGNICARLPRPISCTSWRRR